MKNTINFAAKVEIRWILKYLHVIGCLEDESLSIVCEFYPIPVICQRDCDKQSVEGKITKIVSQKMIEQF